jgi:integrase
VKSGCVKRSRSIDGGAHFGGHRVHTWPEYDRILFKLLLTTGLREREAMHLQWIDISFSRRTLQLGSEPQYEHRAKTAEERELPLTQELAAL